MMPAAGLIAVRNSGRLVLLRVEDIDWIEAADNYVCLHRGADTHVLRETLSNIEARLDESRFTRVHRSAIVNLDRIRELQPWTNGDYRIILNDGTALTLKKTYRARLESQLLTGFRA